MTKIEYKNYIFSDEPGASNQVKPGGQLNLSMSLISDVLEINTFDFVVESEDRSLVRFTKNDLITVYQDDIKIGIFYVQSVERVAANLYSFYAVSAIGLLDQMKHYGGIYTGQTMQEIVSDICGNIPFYIKHNLKNIKLYGWLPIATSRENLSQVLMATGACIKTDMDGIVRIEGLWDGIANIIGKDSLYLGGNVTYDSEVTQVVVVEHQYIEGQEETTLFEGTTQSGDLITFSEPMYDLTADGISILNSNANYAKVSAGAGTLKGKKYIHTTRQIVRPVSAESREVSAADDDQSSVRTVDSATLISLVNSSAVANRLANFYKWVETINTSVAYKREQPGNVVSVYHPYDNEQVNACLQSASVTISSVLAADETLLVGYVPPQIEEEEILENRVLLTGSGEWTAPADASGTARGVLISGGTGGSSGLKGADTEAQRTTSGSDTVTAAVTTYKYSYYTKPGDGGDPGTPGDGGKVFQFEFEITPGKTYRYTCGAGGEGGEPGDSSSPGSSGGVTTFEEYSSEQGSSAPGGFLDVVTGETYATTGDSGISGANGVGYDDDTLIPGGTITVDGVQYGPGNTGETIEKNEGNYSVGYGSKEATALGGLGGGAAYGANGNDGSDGDIARTTDSSATARGGRGGKGADALPPPDETTYGKGGTSGNGGGGAGSPGRARVANRRWKRGDDETSSMPQATLNLWVQASGEGGLGSKGGKGGPGCIVLYYSTSKKIGSGLLIDRNERGFVDKYGRYFVV